ncbi:MAG: ABC transporter permease [Anaerolineaceae bacterium]|nr:ABC transporter permease [Anaerolineaceae bacterium]
MVTKQRKKFPFYIVVFLAPAVIIYTIIMIYPLLASLGLSFFSRTSDNQYVFAGFSNYVTLFTDSFYMPRILGALKNNVIFSLIHLVIQNAIALLLAALVASKGRLRNFYRTVIFMPTVLSFVIIGFVWNLILNPLWGVSESILQAVNLGYLFKPWLGLPDTALITVSLISVWQFMGIPMILLYASLIGIPEELMEAANVDGANGWQSFWKIKFPLLLPTVGVVMILTFVGNFNAFDLIYTMKGANAGPEFATDILGTLFYRTFFGQQLQLGNINMGATVAAVMFLIILTGVLFYVFFWQRRVQNYEM